MFYVNLNIHITNSDYEKEVIKLLEEVLEKVKKGKSEGSVGSSETGPTGKFGYKAKG